MANKAVGFLTFNFGANMGGFNKAMKKAQRSVGKFGKSMKRIGSSMTTNLTMPIVGLGAIAIKTFAEFRTGNVKSESRKWCNSIRVQIIRGKRKKIRFINNVYSNTGC